MASVIHGSDFSSPVYRTGYPRLIRTDSEWEKEVRFYISENSAADYIPEAGDEENDSLAGKLFCREVEITHKAAEGFPEVAEVRIVYRSSMNSSTGGSGSEDTDSVTYYSQSEQQERDIAGHPAFERLTDAEKNVLKAYCPVYTEHTVTVSRTEHREKSSVKLTEELICGTVGELEVPEDMTDNPSPEQWKHTGRTVNISKGESVEITDTWTFSFYGWGGSVTPSLSLVDALALAKAKENKITMESNQ